MAEEKKEGKTKRPTARKRIIQSKKREFINRGYASTVKSALRAAEAAITAGDPEGAKAKLCKIYSLMDKGVKKGIVKKNQAARVKSRMQKRLLKK